jgi:hypothetical protein
MKLLSSKYAQNRFFCTNAGLQRGQGMVEYIIIGALIAIAAIAIYSAWGKTMRLQSAGLAGEIAGKKLDMELVKDATNAASGRANDPLKTGLAQYNYANDSK